MLPELPASFSMTTKPPFPSDPGCSLPRPPPSAVGSPVVSFLCPLGSSLPLGSLSTCREQMSQFGWLLPFSLSALCLLFAPLLWQLSAFFCLSSSNTFLSLPPQASVPTPASAWRMQKCREGRQRKGPFLSLCPLLCQALGFPSGKTSLGAHLSQDGPGPQSLQSSACCWNLPRRPSQSSFAHRQVLHTGEQKDQVRELDPTPCLECGPNSFHGSH